MLLSAMKYGDYTWPHNPKVYEIEYSRRIVSHKTPFGCYILQDMGREQRVLKGQGEFAGKGAYDEFKKLACMFYLDEPQVLVHPVWQSAKAWFVRLELRQEPREDFVSYEFEFWECFDGYETGAALLTRQSAGEAQAGQTAERKSHTLRYGETLWGVARDNGLTLAELLALNPQIRNCNIYYSGDVIYLS